MTGSETGDVSKNGWPRRLEPWLLIAGALALCWAGAGRMSFWDPDEARYVVTAGTMRRTGDYIVPYFNGDFRYQKPVLTYWLIALAQTVLGESEFSARFFSGFCVAGACWCTWRMGNRMFGRPAGLLAGSMLALSPTVLFIGKLSIPDGPQLLFSTICFWTLYELIIAADRGDGGIDVGSAGAVRRCAFLFWLALGATLLTKGPIVAGMLLATLGMLHWLTGLKIRRLPMRLGVGALLLAVVVLPWTAAILYAAGTGFFAEAVGKQLVQRAVRSFDGRFLPPGYYAISLGLGLAPWSPLALLAALHFWKDRRKIGPVSFLYAWSLGSMLVLELFRSKQVHYFAPAYPALALSSSAYLTSLMRRRMARRERFLEPLVLSGLPLTFLGTAVAAAAFIRFSPESCRAPLAWIAGIFGAAGLLVAVNMYRGRILRSTAAAIAAAFAAWLVIGGSLMPALESIRVVRDAGERLGRMQRLTGADSLMLLPIESSLVYYSGRPIEVCDGGKQFLDRIRVHDGEMYTIMSDELFTVVNHEMPGRLQIEESWEGWVKLHYGKLHLVRIPARCDQFADKENDPPR